VTPGEGRIRKQCVSLAKRLLKEDGSCSARLAVSLLKRETDQDMSMQEQTRYCYAFLLKHGIEESVACEISGMNKLLRDP
jgi:hypothetical protein